MQCFMLGGGLQGVVVIRCGVVLVVKHAEQTGVHR